MRLYEGSLDMATRVSGNQGGGNGLDAIIFRGTVTSDLNWISPYNAAAQHALGYLLESDLTMTGPLTLRVPANALVMAQGSITLNGATLDASAGGATFTSLSDKALQATIPACGSPYVYYYNRCNPMPGHWGGFQLNGDAANTGRGNATIKSAKFQYASQAIQISSGASSTLGKDGYGLVVEGSSFSDTQYQTIIGSSTRIWVTGSTIDKGGTFGINADSGGTLSHDLITRTGDYAVYGRNAPLSIDCISVHDNIGGIYAAGHNTTITNSNLYGNVRGGRYDLDVSGSVVTTTADSDWWGQAGGPTAGQVNPPTFQPTKPLSAASSCAP
jgi:hypothetical protein